MKISDLTGNMKNECDFLDDEIKALLETNIFDETFHWKANEV